MAIMTIMAITPFLDPAKGRVSRVLGTAKAVPLD